MVSTFVVVTLMGCNQHDPSSMPMEESALDCLNHVPDPVSLDPGRFSMGSNMHYPEEAPQKSVSISSFSIDVTEVTNAQFGVFVDATGYVTDAEKNQPGFGAPGGSVFMEPSASNPNWWRFVEGANWRHPEGPGSDISGRENEPVVQVSFGDAQAYAEWAGRRLPSEAEWEFAAATQQGPEGANTWQGIFPIENKEADGYRLRAPVGCYEPNTVGLYDMIGNVWEWTASNALQTSSSEPVHVIKGGSFLCAPNFCSRYRASARQFQEIGLPTNHIGFRTVKSLEK